MTYEIKNNGDILGLSKFEFGDPPMGFVHGEFIPNEMYSNRSKYENLTVVCVDTGDELNCISVVIEDYSAEFGEQEIQVTAQLISY